MPDDGDADDSWDRDHQKPATTDIFHPIYSEFLWTMRILLFLIILIILGQTFYLAAEIRTVALGWFNWICKFTAILGTAISGVSFWSYVFPFTAAATTTTFPTMAMAYGMFIKFGIGTLLSLVRWAPEARYKHV